MCLNILYIYDIYIYTRICGRPLGGIDSDLASCPCPRSRSTAEHPHNSVPQIIAPPTFWRWSSIMKPVWGRWASYFHCDWRLWHALVFHWASLGSTWRFWGSQWLPLEAHLDDLGVRLRSQGHVLHLILHSLVVIFPMCALEGLQGRNLLEIVSV